MDIILYFTFGILNIILVFLFVNFYRKKTGIDLFPGRERGDKLEMITYIISYILCGFFGTVIVMLHGISLIMIWLKYYRKK